MAFIPSLKLSEAIARARVGLWIERLQDNRLALVCKIPETAIKALHRGAACTFLLGTVEAEPLVILCLGLKVADEPENPFKVLIANYSPEDLTLLIQILMSANTILHCLNELNHPMLSASCSLDPRSAALAVSALQSSNHWLLRAESIKVVSLTELAPAVELALDRFHSQIHRSQDNPLTEHVRMTAAIPLNLDIWKPTEIFEVTPTYASGPFLIDDKDEGRRLERQIDVVIGSIYPGSSYISPDVQDGKILRELADVLGFDSNWICVVQAKALAVLSANPRQPSSRRTANVEKDIKNGLRQVAGALTKIRDGSTILRHGEATEVAIPNRQTSPAQGLVILSEMYADVNWAAVAALAVKASENPTHRALFHVLDIGELTTLATSCKDAPTFNARLVQRWVVVQEKGTAYIRAKLGVEGTC